MYLLYCIVALLLAINPSETTCPQTFRGNQDEVCISHVGKSNTFCEAAEKCEEYGRSLGLKLFLVGRYSTAIPSYFVGGWPAFWTGVNQLLVRRDTAKDGWYDTNPETPAYTTRKDFPWGATQPVGNGAVTVYNRSDDLFYDHSVTAKPINLDVFCQYNGDSSSTDSAVKFTTNFPVKLVDFVQKNSNFFGCFPGTITESTQLKCALSCLCIVEPTLSELYSYVCSGDRDEQEGRKQDLANVIKYLKSLCKLRFTNSCASNTACRSVYFADGKCVQAIYADSLLPWDIAKSTDGWKRFAKTEVWEH
ncbi:hypothetical protein PHET_02720 [Paragonimus heterotremus]|uniref:C-type lectin domain-containing protein n=1 Tax=Paragonimus heterotremus TaxID=100268 RepID=A0A8J4SRV8_9TREM|nr:hypothetical protein PHET_02720 [Paragonimus heterotremus]